MKGKKITKLCALALASVMLISTVAGCSGGDKKGAASGGTDSSTTTQGAVENPTTAAPENGETGASATDGAVWDGETSHIVVTYLTGTSSLPADFQLIQDKVNEMTVPKIGVEVEFKPITVFEAMSQYSMWIGAGEKIDLMQIAFTDMQSYITQGMIEPLDGYIDSCAPYLQTLYDEGNPVYDANPTGNIYGIGVWNPAYGSAGGFLMTKEAMELTGLDYKDDDKVTLDDLTEIFAKIKEASPDTYPCGVTGKLPPSSYVIVNDPLGATLASGALIGLDSTTVVNFYETDEYYDYLKHARDWYEKGYILKDAATSEVSNPDNLKSGTTSGYFSEGGYGLRVGLENNIGKACMHLMLNDPYRRAINSSGGAYWTIPVTCSAPEAAMRFVNMLYEDADLANLIQYGIAGEHFKFIDEKNGVIEIPSDSKYINSLGLWGIQGNMYAIGYRDREADEKWSGTALANKTKGYGFCYDASNMTNQIIAVQGVISEYTPALETGSAELEKTYEEFIAKLKANGIDEIIQDKQAQFDAWLVQQGSTQQ